MRCILTLTSDFGRDSIYVAQMKAVLLSINPHLTLLDITHEIPPQDVAAGAWVLRQVIPAFPPQSIHLAVVDPGVGTLRSCLAADLQGRYVIAPDNGLISLAAQRLEVRKMVRLEAAAYRRPVVSNTFHGRDIMAPAAAWLSLGTPLECLGPLHHEYAVLAERFSPSRESRRLVGKVLFVDRFGNLISNIQQGDLPETPHIIVSVAQHSVQGLTTTYGVKTPGELIALIDSQGYLEIAVVNGNAAQTLGVSVGSPVVVTW